MLRKQRNKKDESEWVDLDFPDVRRLLTKYNCKDTEVNEIVKFLRDKFIEQFGHSDLFDSGNQSKTNILDTWSHLEAIVVC